MNNKFKDIKIDVDYKTFTLKNGTKILNYITYKNINNNFIKLLNNNYKLNLEYFKELLNNICSNTDYVISTDYDILNIYYENNKLIIAKGIYSIIIFDINEALLIITGIILDLQS